MWALIVIWPLVAWTPDAPMFQTEDECRRFLLTINAAERFKMDCKWTGVITLPNKDRGGDYFDLEMKRAPG
jgi:hypothetical protein